MTIVTMFLKWPRIEYKVNLLLMYLCMTKNIMMIVACTSTLLFTSCASQGNLRSENTNMLTDSKKPSTVITNMAPVVNTSVTTTSTGNQMKTVESSLVREKAAYIKYTKDLYTAALGKKPLVLFFHASWCPTCKIIEKDLNRELASFPEGTLILETDYDTETLLKQTYGITSQSILVILDAQGSVVKKLMAPENEQIKSAIQASLQ